MVIVAISLKSRYLQDFTIAWLDFVLLCGLFICVMQPLHGRLTTLADTKKPAGGIAAGFRWDIALSFCAGPASDAGSNHFRTDIRPADILLDLGGKGIDGALGEVAATGRAEFGGDPTDGRQNSHALLLPLVGWTLLMGPSMRPLFQRLSAVTDQAFSTLLTMNFP
jgi:hypothetical protein